MTEILRLELPLWQVPLLLLLPLVLLGMAVYALRRSLRQRSVPGEEPDWSVPALEDAGGQSLFHRWEVRCKLVSLLLYAFLVASLQQLGPALAALGLSLLALVLARTPWSRALLRLLALSGFLTMFMMVMPLSAAVRPGDTLVVFAGLEWLEFNLRGLQLAATIAAKGAAIALLSEPLLATAPLPLTLQGLSRLGAPAMVGQMVLLSHRYLHVFRQEALRMAAGMQVRGFRKRTDLPTFHAVANFLGMLFVRSFERTERVFEAMQARGYQGRLPAPDAQPLLTRDLVLGGLWLLLGVALVAFDRWVG